MAYYDNPFGAYQHANKTKSHTEQIIMCYCQAISFVQQAKQAHINNDHAMRYELIDKTIAIIRGLRACLNFDVAEKVAEALNKYYENIEIMLMAVQCEDNKEEICDMVVDNLRKIKRAWEGVHNMADTSEDDVSPININTPANDYEKRDISI